MITVVLSWIYIFIICFLLGVGVFSLGTKLCGKKDFTAPVSLLTVLVSKKLVAYFSASGITAKVAEDLADAIGADIFEIRPEVPYTKADLNWMDKKSRSTIEMSNPDFRPAIAAKRDNMDEYDTIFVGFPIWWYVAPTIINTFLESYDLKNKTIIPFATSGSSDMGKTNEKLAPSCPGSKLLHGKVFNASSTKADLSAWVDSLNF